MLTSSQQQESNKSDTRLKMDLIDVFPKNEMDLKFNTCTNFNTRLKMNLIDVPPEFKMPLNFNTRLKMNLIDVLQNSRRL